MILNSENSLPWPLRIIALCAPINPVNGEYCRCRPAFRGSPLSTLPGFGYNRARFSTPNTFPNA